MDRSDIVEVAQLSKRVVTTKLSGGQTQGGVAILINGRGQVLLSLARYRTAWTFPGGYANLNEEPVIAIARELSEEVAYPESAPKLIIVHQSDRSHHLEYFAMAFVDANVADRLHPVSWEIRSIRWCGPHEMPRLHPLTRALLSDGEGVLSQLQHRWVPGPVATVALQAAKISE
jgi:8-oxo-dGTP pyrophosphatase MutT (NUDIX family)